MNNRRPHYDSRIGAWVGMIFRIAFVACIFTCPSLRASTIAADTIYVSTISGQPTGNGISFSSHIILASGASLSLQGSGGYINTASSVTASAFSGDGSHLTGVASPQSTQTFTGSNTFASSFSVRSGGNQVLLSTSPSSNNLSLNADGTVSFFPELHNSSSTRLSEFTTSASSFGPCVTGSTLAITTAGGRVEVVFTGDIQLSSSVANIAGMSFLVDGEFAPGLTDRKGFSYQQKDSGQDSTTGFDYLLDVLTPGTHQFCLTLATLNFPYSLKLLNRSDSFQNYAGNIFYVKEIR
jgi:hypothetical protein